MNGSVHTKIRFLGLSVGVYNTATGMYIPADTTVFRAVDWLRIGRFLSSIDGPVF